MWTAIRRPNNVKNLTTPLARKSPCRVYSSLRTNYNPGGRRFDPKRVYEQIQLRKQRAAQQNQYQYQYNNQSIQPHEGGILQPNDGIVDILSRHTLYIQRQMEYMNLFMGIEQANRYVIMDENANPIGYMEEEDFGFTKMLMRQFYRLHRPFSVRVMNLNNEHILTIRRPFSFINSHIKAILPSTHKENEIVIGETKQQWHLWRRRYNLFLSSGDEEFTQYGAVDAGFLSFMFPVQDEQGQVLGSVDRNWVGLAREMFTDTGVYALRMDPVAFSEMRDVYPKVSGPLSLDERAVMLGTAVSIDFDYFSRHSGHGGGLFGFHYGE